MRILHVVPSLSPHCGGTTSAVLSLASALQKSGMETTVVTTTSSDELPPVAAEASVRVHVFECRRKSKWRYSLGLKKFLDVNIAAFDVIHLHGLWLYPQYAAARLASLRGIPTVLSTHGMLNEWAIHHRRLRKRIYYLLIEKRNMSNASCIHAITSMEREAILRWMPKAHIAVIPNGIDLAQVDEVLNGKGAVPPEPERLILFLGRIHPVKAIDQLVDAFHGAGLDPSWRLVIAGPPEVPSYLRELEQRVREYRLEQQVVFTGSVYGPEKWRLLQRAWLAAVPSHTEVIGLVNLEACACGTPSITSLRTGVSAWDQSGGLLFDPADPEKSLAAQLRAACHWSVEERLRRGRLSRQHIASKYDMRVLAEEWRRLYASILHSAPMNEAAKSLRT